jgi:anti-sigma regulatory factor (Ser/Thr protein kinase)
MQPALSVPLESHPSSPGLARSYALELVAPWASPEFAMDTCLLVTELVANAVIHGGSRIRLEIIVQRTFICVEVFDGSFVRPVIRPNVGGSTTGRGLQLVNAIATSWGTRPHPDGKVVWFELHVQ